MLSLLSRFLVGGGFVGFTVNTPSKVFSVLGEQLHIMSSIFDLIIIIITIHHHHSFIHNNKI